MKVVRGLFLLDQNAYDVVYAPTATAEIAGRVDLVSGLQTRQSIKENYHLLADVDAIFSGWGCPRMDQAFLDRAPNLKVVFYGAGAITGWATQAVWNRDILVTTANEANAIPVAEYTLATILFSLKHGWRLMNDKHTVRGFTIRKDIPGNYNSVVGLIGCGAISQLLIPMLEPFDMKVLVYDPFLPDIDATRLRVKKVDLETLFAESDVVSLHAPDNPSTSGMITGRLISSMKEGATFINTARGRLVREDELIDALTIRTDLQAVLDVTREEPLPASSPLNLLPNIVHTPHLAGSQGRECQRMGQYMVDELDRYLADVPLQWQVRPKHIAHSVHQMHLDMTPAKQSVAST